MRNQPVRCEFDRAFTITTHHIRSRCARRGIATSKFRVLAFPFGLLIAFFRTEKLNIPLASPKGNGEIHAEQLQRIGFTGRWRAD
jgi:hypothetical protein